MRKIDDFQRDHPELALLPRVLARPMGVEQSGRVVFLGLDQVSYFFRGSAALDHLISSAWNPRPAFIADRIYIRTVKGALFQAAYRSMADILEQFGGPLFPIHQSLLVNLNALYDAELRSVAPQVGMRAGPGVDHLAVARRRAPELKRWLIGRRFGG